MQIQSLVSPHADVGLLAVAVAQDAVEATLRSLLGEAAEAVLSAADAHGFTGKLGSSAVFPSLGVIPARWVALVGLGDESGAAATDALRRAAGLAGKAARSHGLTSAGLAFGAVSGADADAVLEGFSVGNYAFDRYKADAARKAAVETLFVSGEAAGPVAAAIAAGQAWARDLVNEPGAAIYPQSLAEQAETLRAAGLEVTVWDEDKLIEEGMGGITAVGQGSAQPPRFIHVAWKPANPTRKVALVGKGVTFDAGGLSIKPTSGMLTMKCDMGGSACVLGVLRAVADLKPDVEVHGLIGAAENMLGGNAFKLGDVVTMRNGKTVEIHNTDAEGRLCLADCLSYGSELGVDQMVDIATLTGAAVVALGPHYSALMTRSEGFASSLMGHAEDAGEGLWRLPLPAFYKDMLKSEIATVKNVGGRAAGSITAGLFLNEFVTDTEWAHIDIAGPAFLDKGRRHFGHGGTGAMVPTLTRWVLQG